jgi:hypothetical protein
MRGIKRVFLIHGGILRCAVYFTCGRINSLFHIIDSGDFKDVLRAKNIYFIGQPWFNDGTVHMDLGGKMEYNINIPRDLFKEIIVSDVPIDQLEVTVSQQMSDIC